MEDSGKIESQNEPRIEHGLNTDGRIVNQGEPVRPQSREIANREFVMVRRFPTDLIRVSSLAHYPWPDRVTPYPIG